MNEIRIVFRLYRADRTRQLLSFYREAYDSFKIFRSISNKKSVHIYIYIYIFAIFDERNSNRISFKQIRERDNSDMLCVSAISLSVSFLSWTRRTIRFKFFVRFRINVTYMYFCNFWWTKYIHVKGHCLKDIVCWQLSVIFRYECFFAKLDLFFRFNVQFFSWYEEAVWKLLSREQLGIISYDTLYLFVY